jgi:hypothetical protein
MSVIEEQILIFLKFPLPLKSWVETNPSPSQIKELGNGYSIISPGKNLVPAQPKLGQRLWISKIGVCHPTKKISGGEHCFSTLIFSSFTAVVIDP